MFSKTINAVGVVHSPFKEKFAVPRQAKLVADLISEIEMFPPYDDLNCFRGIENFSHLWLIFDFNLIEDHSFRPMVRPPRLGGKRRIGVFATRSPFRPNNIGLSSVANRGVIRRNNKTLLCVAGADLVDGTPIIDIKPYIRFTDAVECADSSYAQEEPGSATVEFSPEALAFVNSLDPEKYPHFEEIVREIVSYDPRPAYKNKTDIHEYGFSFYDFNIRFRSDNPEHITVTQIRPQ